MATEVLSKFEDLRHSVKEEPIKGLSLAFLSVLLFLTPLVIFHSFHHAFTEAKQIFVGFMAVGLFSLWLTGTFVRKRMTLPLGRATTTFAAFLVWQLVTFAWSASFHLSLRAWGLQLAFFVFYFVVVTAVRKSRLRLLLLFCPILAATLVSALALLQYYEWDVHILPHLRVRGLFDMGVLIMLKRAETQVKIYSFLGHRNYVAGYLMAAVPLFITLILSSLQHMTDKGARLGNIAFTIVLFVALAISLATIMLTHTRGSWVGLSAGLFVNLLLVFKVLHRDEIKKPFVVLLSLSILFCAFVAFVPSANRMKQSTVSRLKSTLNLRAGSVNERRLLLKTAWRMITSDLKTFFLGRGMGTYPIHHVPFQSQIIHEPGGEQYWSVVNKTWYVHNEVLNFWAETGLVGVIFIALFLYHLFLPPLKCLGDSERPLFEVLLLAGVISSMVATLVHNLFTFSLHLPSSGTLFYCLAGMLVGTASKPIEREFSGAKRHLLLLVGVIVVAAVVNGLSAAAEAQILWRRAFTLSSDGAQLKAIQLMTRAVSLDPGNLDLVFDYGRLLQDSNRPDESRKVYDSIKDVFIDASIDHNIANTYRGQGKKKLAFDHYERALYHSPVHRAALYWYCRTLVDERRWQEAYSKLKNGVRYRPYDADLAFLAGLSAFALHKDDEAKELFERVLDLKPGNERARALANLVPALKKSPDGGVSLIKKVWANRPKDWFIRILAERVGVVAPKGIGEITPKGEGGVAPKGDGSRKSGSE